MSFAYGLIGDAEQDDDHAPSLLKINAVPGAIVDAQLTYPLSHWLCVADQPVSETIQTTGYDATSSFIFELRPPLSESLCLLELGHRTVIVVHKLLKTKLLFPCFSNPRTKLWTAGLSESCRCPAPDLYPANRVGVHRLPGRRSPLFLPQDKWSRYPRSSTALSLAFCFPVMARRFFSMPGCFLALR